MVLLMVLCLGCGTGEEIRSSHRGDGAGKPDFETISRYGRRLGFAPLSEDTTRVTALPLQVLPLDAVSITWMGRAPVPEMVMVNSGGSGWRPTLGDKELMSGWKSSLAAVLDLSPAQLEALGGDARPIAEDLTRLLVDPDPGMGMVVAAQGDVPVDHPLSDVRQDLETSGRDPSQIERMFAASIPTAVHPPAFKERSDHRLTVTFYTWDLHGGLVRRWRVRLGKDPKIEDTVIAEGVGSYRRFLY